jgi:hypothetical protein
VDADLKKIETRRLGSENSMNIWTKPSKPDPNSIWRSEKLEAELREKSDKAPKKPPELKN